MRRLLLRRARSAVAAVLGLVSLVAPALPQGSLASHPRTWTPVGPPSPLAGALSVYDPVRRRWILDGWVFDCAGGAGWMWRGEETPVAFAELLFDSRRDRLLGVTSGGALWTSRLDDERRWRPEPTANPHPLAGPLVYDPVRDRVLEIRSDGSIQQLPLGHGPAAADRLTPDARLAWMPLAVRNPLPGAPSHAVFDPGLNVVAATVPVRPAGIPDDVQGVYHDHLWKLSLDGEPTWSLVAVDAGLDATKETVVLDPIRHQVLVAGGLLQIYDSNNVYDDESLARVVAASLVSGDATFSARPPLPEPRDGHVAVYDTGGDRMLVFGGGWAYHIYGGGGGSLCCFTDVVALPGSGTDWRGIAEGWDFDGSSMIFDPSRREFVRSARTDPYPNIVDDSFGFSRDVVQLLDVHGGLRTYLPGLFRGDGIYDPRGDRFVCLDGEARCPGVTTPGQFDRRLLVIGRDSTSLLPVETGAVPPILVSPNLMYDDVRHRMLVFGGIEAQQPTCQPPPDWATHLWALTLDGSWSWSALPTAGTGPPGGLPMFSVYDPRRDQLIAWAPDSARAWLLPLATLEWSHVDPQGPAAFHRRAVYDPRRDRLLTFDDAGKLWALSLGDRPAWAEAPAPSLAPGAPKDLAYDAGEDRLYVTIGTDIGALRSSWAVYALDLGGEEADHPHRGPARPERPALRVVSRDPTTGVPTIEFALRGGEVPVLEMWDVAGRRVWRNAVGPLGPGLHRLAVGEGAAMAPGVYLLRLVGAGPPQVAKVTLLR